MDTPEEQLKALRARVRNLERSLAESEALSLEQIECTHRLERQLVEAQAQLENRDQALASYRQEHELLAHRPSPELLQEKDEHIKELQQLIWDLERRPTQEHVQILQAQINTSQTQIEMLKAELERRIDPSRFFELQQELGELKEYANQLGDYAARLPQVQLDYAQSQLQTHELEAQVTALNSQITDLTEALNQRPTPDEVEARLQSLRDHYEAMYEPLQTQLATAQAQIAELEQRPTPEAITEVQTILSQVQDQLASSESERLALVTEVEQRIPVADVEAQIRAVRDAVRQEYAEQITQLQTQLKSLHHDLTTAQRDQAKLQDELQQRPSLQAFEQLKAEIQHLRAALQEAEARHAEWMEEADHRPSLTQFQEAQRRRELAEAHNLVNKKQIERLQQQVEDLKTECVQAHAHAQTQEKEVALLESTKHDLEAQLSALQDHYQQVQSQLEDLQSHSAALPASRSTSPRILPDLRRIPGAPAAGGSDVGTRVVAASGSRSGWRGEAGSRSWPRPASYSDGQGSREIAASAQARHDHKPRDPDPSTIPTTPAPISTWSQATEPTPDPTPTQPVYEESESFRRLATGKIAPMPLRDRSRTNPSPRSTSSIPPLSLDPAPDSQTQQTRWQSARSRAQASDPAHRSLSTGTYGKTGSQPDRRPAQIELPSFIQRRPS